MIRLKRAYDEPAAADGKRILVERLWPRGVTKEEADLDGWAKDLAPSADLRKWYGHEVDRWPEFQKRYRAELESAEKEDALKQLADQAKHGPVTFVYAAKDTEHNGAVVLKGFIEDRFHL